MNSLVAIVGRPNVGKSTLLNRLSGTNVALVADRPGVTRDRLYARARLGDQLVTLVDTGGLDLRARETLEQAAVDQARAAIEQADLIFLVVDARDGLNPLDSEIATLLRRSGRPVLLLVNKVDPGARARQVEEFHVLGFDLFAVSAAHGTGLDEVERAAARMLEQTRALPEPEDEQECEFRFCLLGRPNVGKSSLANRLAGEQRLIVSQVPGTTRDAVDIYLQRQGLSCLLVDTPGVRRRRAIVEQLEQASVMAAIRSLDRADVAVVVLDAEQEPATQDARLVRLVVERGRGLVLVLNKIDLVPRRQWPHLRERWRHALRFVSWAPLLEVSALTGQGVGRILPAVSRVVRAARQRLSTGHLNRLLASFTSKLPPPLVRGRRAKLFYVTQTRVAPPTFNVVVSDPQRLPESYRRYLENSLRRQFPFEGVPLLWVFRPRPGRERGGKQRPPRRRR